MPANPAISKSRFTKYLKQYESATKQQYEKRSAADDDVASFNWEKGAALAGALNEHGGDEKLARKNVLSLFSEEFGDRATTQHARLCLEARLSFPDEESRVGRGWTACAVIVAPVRRLLRAKGDSDPTYDMIGSYARTYYLTRKTLRTVADLKAAVKADSGEGTSSSRSRARTTLSKVKKTLAAFLKSAESREHDAFIAILNASIAEVANLKGGTKPTPNEVESVEMGGAK